MTSFPGVGIPALATIVCCSLAIFRSNIAIQGLFFSQGYNNDLVFATRIGQAVPFAEDNTAASTFTGTGSYPTTEPVPVDVKDHDHYHHADQTMLNVKSTRLILHIGPPKTGSTTLQTDLGGLSAFLLADGYLYLGKQRAPELEGWKLQEKLLNVSCHSDLESHRFLQQQNGTNPLNHNYIDVDCWRVIVLEFQQLREQFPNTHIVLSEEGFSQAGMLNSYENRPAFLEAFLETLRMQELELTVVAAYRHYEKQLFSAHKMQCSGEPARMKKNDCQRPVMEKLEEWVNNSDRIYLTRPLNRVLAIWQQQQPAIPILMLDLENTQIHPTVQFICETLRLGHNASSRSSSSSSMNACVKARDKVTQTHARSITYFRAKREDMLFRIEQELFSKGATNIYKADLDMFLWSFYNEFDQWCRITDLSWQCPSQEQLGRLLRHSLLLEEQSYPNLSSGRFDNLTLHERQQEHKEHFWRSALEEKTYCDFDALEFLKDFNVTSKMSWSTLSKGIGSILKQSCTTKQGSSRN